MTAKPTGDGGNTVLRNQNEADILAATVAAVPVVAPANTYQEDDSYLTPMFRDADVAGS